MKKIVRGKIKSIDAILGKKEESLEGEDIECIEYRIILENDNNEYITKSSLDFKEGSIVDICFNENKKNKDDTKKDSIIINKKVSKKLLEQLSGAKLVKWFCYPSLLFLILFITKVVASSPSSINAYTGIIYTIIIFMCLYLISILEKMYNEISFSKEDIKLLEKYKKDFKIKNEEVIDKVKEAVL